MSKRTEKEAREDLRKQKEAAGLPVEDESDEDDELDEEKKEDEEDDLDTSKDEDKSEKKDEEEEEDDVDEDEDKDEEKDSDDSDDSDDEDEDEESEDDEDDDDKDLDDAGRSKRGKFKDAVKATKAHWKGKYNSMKEAKEALEAKLEKYETAVEDDDEEKADEAEDDVKALAKELDVDEKAVDAILKAAERRAKKVVDVGTQDLREQERQRAEEVGFTNEFNSVAVTEFKKSYPNASKSALIKAQAKMKEFAYSDKYVNKDMDYILFKEKSVFEKILHVPKKKGMESGIRKVSGDDGGDEPGSKPLGADPSPKEIRAREAYLNREAGSSRTKTKMTSMSEGGDLEETEF